MRQKIAKNLRRNAREMTKGMPERRLEGLVHQATRKRAKSTQAVNAQGTTRALYRQLKQWYKAGKIKKNPILS